MKKNFRFMVLLLCIALTAGMLTACGGSAAPSSAPADASAETAAAPA